MANSVPLKGKTIFLTGTQKVQAIAPFIEGNGGNVQAFPLIESREIVAVDDDARLQQLNTYDWLIFTSQNAVSAFSEKMKRANMCARDLTCKMAVVGEKTAEALRQLGFYIDFMPSVYSADIFVQEFAYTGKALFLRGSLAKPTITIGIGADEWTVYETVHASANIEGLKCALQAAPDPIVVLASPSAVEAYAAEVVPAIDWSRVRFATIGHVTTAALARYDVQPIVQPQTYTMKAVIEQIILEESS